MLLGGREEVKEKEIKDESREEILREIKKEMKGVGGRW